jgi:hypothetical protein
MRASFGAGLGQAVATIRFSPPPRGDRSMTSRLAAEVLPGLAVRRGLSSACLLESQPAPSTPRLAHAMTPKDLAMKPIRG